MFNRAGQGRIVNKLRAHWKMEKFIRVVLKVFQNFKGILQYKVIKSDFLCQ